MFLDPAAECTDAEALGRVVPGGDVVDAILCSLVHHPLGGLTGHVGVESRRHRLVKLALGGAGHDADRRHQAVAARENQRLSIARLGDGGEELVRLDRLWENTAHTCGGTGVDAEAFELLEPEATSQLGGVAEFEMPVERQVIGDQ